MSKEFANMLREGPPVDDIEGQNKRVKFIQDQLEKMNEEQLIRFDFFMRSHFQKNKIKSLITSNLQPRFQDTNITDEITIVVSSLAKLYVGELVETATEILKNDKDEPPGLRKAHILEAYQKLSKSANFDVSNSPFLFNSNECSFYDNEDVDFDPFRGKMSKEEEEKINDLLEDSTNSLL